MSHIGRQATIDGLTLRDSTPSDCQKILSLFNNIFKMDRSETHWKWKFVDNPVNLYFAVVAEYEEEIVGHYALLPNWMVRNGSKILGGMTLDAMVHPNLGRKGLFVELANSLFSRLASENVELIYGFPNEKSFSVAVKKLGYRYMGRMPQFAKVLNPYSILRNKTKSPIAASVLTLPTIVLLKVLSHYRASRINKHSIKSQIVILNGFDLRFDALWEQISKRSPISVWKDSIYLNWRYIQCPDTDYIVFAAQQESNINGFLVLKIEEPAPPRRPYRTGYIVDFLFLPEKITDGESLILSSLRYLRDKNVDMVISHCFEHSLSYPLFRSIGFLKHGVGLPILGISNLQLSGEDELNLGKWQLQPGDTDVF